MLNVPKIFTVILIFLITTSIPSKSDEIETDKVETSSLDYNTSPHDEEIYDPFEPVNRVIFKFNNAADKVILEPAAKGYRQLPSPVQTGIGNFFSNLKSEKELREVSSACPETFELFIQQQMEVAKENGEL